MGLVVGSGSLARPRPRLGGCYHAPRVLTFRFRITGRVQGVGYRYFALTEANALGIAGYAKNLPDGSVEIVAEGAEEAVRSFEERLREGPAFCRVELVDKAPLGPRGDQDFHIR